MWRRVGDGLYAGLALVAFTVEAAALGALTWTFVVGVLRSSPAEQLDGVLLGTVGTTALMLMVVSLYVLRYHSLSLRVERRNRDQLTEWTERWMQVVIGAQAPPKAPLPRPAVESLIDMRETLAGRLGDELVALIEGYGISKDLVSRMHSRRQRHQLMALESLAKIRIPRSCLRCFNRSRAMQPPHSWPRAPPLALWPA